MPRTKEEIKQYNKEYFQKNKERLRPIRQKYKEDHREELREYTKEYLHNYYINNKEKVIATIKKWESNNKGRIREWRRQYDIYNRERYKLRRRIYVEKNKDKLNNYNRKYYHHIKANYPILYKRYYITNRKRNTNNYLMIRFYALLDTKVKVPRLYKFRNDLYYNNKKNINLLLLNKHKVNYLEQYKQFKKEINDMIENDLEYNQQCEDECDMLADKVFYLHKGRTYTDWFERNLLND